MSTQELAGTTALVTGASRGFGRGIAISLAKAGASVVAVARGQAALDDLRAQSGGDVIPVVADATDPVVAGRLIAEYKPRTLVLNAGQSPLMHPLDMHTWETFSRNWNVDVQHAFHWIRESLLLPLDPGSVVIAMSSGAALAGSPLSGGYAGAKSTIRFIAAYAADESARRSLGIRFHSVLPGLSPSTHVGETGARAYAARAGLDYAAFVERLGPTLTAEQVGSAFVDLATDPAYDRPTYRLGPAGLSEVA